MRISDSDESRPRLSALHAKWLVWCHRTRKQCSRNGLYFLQAFPIILESQCCEEVSFPLIKPLRQTNCSWFPQTPNLKRRILVQFFSLKHHRRKRKELDVDHCEEMANPLISISLLLSIISRDPISRFLDSWLFLTAEPFLSCTASKILFSRN